MEPPFIRLVSVPVNVLSGPREIEATPGHKSQVCGTAGTCELACGSAQGFENSSQSLEGPQFKPNLRQVREDFVINASEPPELPFCVRCQNWI